MIEELLMNVVNAMSSCLDEEQLDKLQNVLYINFHDVRVVEEKNELQATGTDSDTAKMRLFVASKKCQGGRIIHWRSISGKSLTAETRCERILRISLRWICAGTLECSGSGTKSVWLRCRGGCGTSIVFGHFCKKRILLKIIQWRVSNRYVLRALSKRRFRHRSWKHFEWFASVRGIGRS